MANNHPNLEDLQEAVEWCKTILSNDKKYVILDTETTGLGDNDEIIEMAIISTTGKVLFNERFSTFRAIGKEASKVHGITKKDLRNCQSFKASSEQIEKAIGTKNIITYNANFDARMYAQTMKNIKNGFVPKGEWLCAMDVYSQFVGQINPNTGDYRWQKLQGGDHSALGDCNATLSLINTMASKQT